MIKNRMERAGYILFCLFTAPFLMAISIIKRPFNKYIVYAGYSLFSLFVIPLLMVISILKKGKKKQKTKVIFGTTPIINNKYWSNALKEIGIESETLMSHHYPNNSKEDYDIYFDDLVPKILKKKYLKEVVHLFFVWYYVITEAKYFVMSYDGVVFNKYFWRLEYLLFKLNGIKTIVIPYGGDVWMTSRIRDTSRTNSLLIDYPQLVAKEISSTRKVFFWAKYADVVLSGFMANNGVPRWDVAILSYLQIDTKEWTQKKHYSSNNGINGPVKIIHTPNHRGCKGTEFLINSVSELKKEGFNIELILVENKKNSEVKRLMQHADILAEQFIATNYALSATEGLSTGLPVLSNLEDESLTKMFRRYSFLNECPVLSTSPETLNDNLRLLITNPELRRELGMLGRRFVEKYHSYEMAQHLFTNILKKIDGEDIDLINLYHPLKSSYVKNNYIKTPLVNNKYKLEVPVLMAD